MKIHTPKIYGICPNSPVKLTRKRHEPRKKYHKAENLPKTSVAPAYDGTSHVYASTWMWMCMNARRSLINFNSFFSAADWLTIIIWSTSEIITTLLAWMQVRIALRWALLLSLVPRAVRILTPGALPSVTQKQRPPNTLTDNRLTVNYAVSRSNMYYVQTAAQNNVEILIFCPMFFLFTSWARTRWTDGRARQAMQPIRTTA